MAYVSTVTASRDFTRRAASATGVGIWQRLFDAMVAARQRQAEREIGFYLESVGDKFTDGVEREIENRFLFDSRR